MSGLEKLKEKVKNVKKKVDIIDFAFELGEKLDELMNLLVDEIKKQNEVLGEIKELLNEINEKIKRR